MPDGGTDVVGLATGSTVLVMPAMTSMARDEPTAPIMSILRRPMVSTRKNAQTIDRPHLMLPKTPVVRSEVFWPVMPMLQEEEKVSARSPSRERVEREQHALAQDRRRVVVDGVCGGRSVRDRRERQEVEEGTD